MCPWPACLAFLSPGPFGCFVGSALLSLNLLFFISLHLSSPFHFCFSFIRQPLSASLGCRRSELAGIVGATCNTLHHLSSLPPVNSKAGTLSTTPLSQHSP